MFDALTDRLEATFKGLRGKGRLSDADIDATAREIRVALLEADVALPVVKAFVAAVKEQARSAQVSEALNPAQQVVKIVNTELTEILGGRTRALRLARTPPTVVLLVGLQGSGKTTLAGKLGRWLSAQKHTPLLVACDLQRPDAVGQLSVVGRRAGVEVFAPEPGNGVGDPVDVARRGVEHARRSGHDVVVVDTAGRLGVDAELMEQAAQIRDAVEPDEVLFVVDAMIGQDAVTTASAFGDGVGFDGVVLTKLDGDARGGAALSVRHVTGRPVMFASTGEGLEDFDVFHPERMASRILGMGDVLTLIDKAEQAFDAEQAEDIAGKMIEGAFTFEDFLEQMRAVRKMGNLGSLLKMMPGMGQFREQLDAVSDSDLDRITAIVLSMTPGERRDHKVLNASRRRRIAAGSGTSVPEVNALVERFEAAQKMMSSLASGGSVPGLPGLPGLPGAARRKAGPPPRKAKKGKGKGGSHRSGRPGAVRSGAGARAPGGAPTAPGALSPEFLDRLHEGLPTTPESLPPGSPFRRG